MAMHVGVRQKKVLDFLKANQLRRFTLDELKAEPTFKGVAFDDELLQKLQVDNPKIAFLDGLYSFKPPHPNVRCKDDIVPYLVDLRGGLYVSELAESYPGAEIDLRDLHAEGKLILIPRLKLKEEVVIAVQRDMTPLDEDLRKEWTSIPIPDSIEELKEKMRIRGLPIVTHTIKHIGTSKDNSEPRKRQRTQKLVNDHIYTSADMNSSTNNSSLGSHSFKVG
eukprot:c16699_g1_i1.p1 GENE.c16699_g1_i1~~c16699_g1_i1.p1  ORF type:complete len:222 (+),score=45.44 c16699_g1_i1:34-699(+)